MRFASAMVLLLGYGAAAFGNATMAAAELVPGGWLQPYRPPQVEPQPVPAEPPPDIRPTPGSSSRPAVKAHVHQPPPAAPKPATLPDNMIRY